MPVLKGTKNFYDFEISQTLDYNLQKWLEYGLVEMGAYTNARFDDAATSGLTNLKRVYDDRYGANRVFEGFGPSWVWESGVSVINSLPSPSQVSGIYVNNSFMPLSTTGAYAYTVDYRNGRIIFDNDVPTASGIKCEYTFRDVEVYVADDPRWRSVVRDVFSQYNSISTLSPSGVASVLKEKRFWMPSIVVESRDLDPEGMQLGGGEFVKCGVYYHVFAETPGTNKKLANILVNQGPKTLRLFDLNKITFPLQPNGAIASGALTYSQLTNPDDGTYFWTFGSIYDTQGGPRNTLFDIYRAEVSQIIEVQRYNSTY